MDVRCKMTPNSSAPAIKDSHIMDEESQSSDIQINEHSLAQGHKAGPLSGPWALHSSQMESKLDLNLRKLQTLEYKNKQPEEKLNSQQ